MCVCVCVAGVFMRSVCVCCRSVHEECVCVCVCVAGVFMRSVCVLQECS